MNNNTARSYFNRLSISMNNNTARSYLLLTKSYPLYDKSSASFTTIDIDDSQW
jgi:hypothetical protein